MLLAGLQLRKFGAADTGGEGRKAGLGAVNIWNIGSYRFAICAVLPSPRFWAGRWADPGRDKPEGVAGGIQWLKGGGVKLAATHCQIPDSPFLRMQNRLKRLVGTAIVFVGCGGKVKNGLIDPLENQRAV